MPFVIKQWIKMLLQFVLLPIVYGCCRLRRTDPDRVIFADAHHDVLPDAMEEMEEAVRRLGKKTILHCVDFGQASFLRTAREMLRFMRDYAGASAVFICDYYLPVNACRRRKETQVIQLWHACGALKKFGFDAADDIPSYYAGNPMKNVTLVTVSSVWCEKIYAGAMGLAVDRVKALGVSRTDRCLDPRYNARCRESFAIHHPECAGKKIALWAPTFRGNAARPELVGEEAIRQLERELGEEWFLIRKLHPHMEGKLGHSNCEEKTEALLPVCDVMITDYSSILFDYLLYRKPLVLFAPDADSYEAGRGLYISYSEIPGQRVTDIRGLADAVRNAGTDPRKTEVFLKRYMEACDGRATEKILRKVFEVKPQ